MDLSKCKIIPGCIIDAKDPKKIGRVKCMVPTIFNTDQMSKDGLPWVYPFTMPGYQRFSAPQTGQKVWVIQNPDNYNEYWYVPMEEFISDTSSLLENDDDYGTAEILMSRNLGAMSVFMYYLKSKGIILQLGDSTSINITPDGEVHLNAGDSQVQVTSDHVVVGNKNDEHEVTVLGEQLYKLLLNLNKNLQKVATATLTSPYTLSLAAPLLSTTQTLAEDVEKIRCKNTLVN